LYAASGSKGLVAVDTRTGKVTESGIRPGWRYAVTPAGDRIVGYESAGLFSARLTARGVEREWSRGVRNRDLFASVSLAFFPDGERFASAEYRFIPSGPDTWVRIRSAKDGSIIDKIGPKCGVPDQVAVSPDGVWVALRAAASLLIFHQTDAGKSVKLTSPNRKHLTAMAFHPGGRYLAATSNDATVRMHDRDAGWEVTKTFDWEIGKLKSVAFSPDGNLAAAGSDTGKVVVWDVNA
jgi:WD40 repeat protein